MPSESYVMKSWEWPGCGAGDFSGHEAVRVREDGLHVWSVERLWRLATAFTPERVPLAELEHLLDMDGWFRGDVPTVRRVAEHARRIAAADCSYPVLLAADGGMFDGLHRLARLYLDDYPDVWAVRFPVDPPPDRVETPLGWLRITVNGSPSVPGED